LGRDGLFFIFPHTQFVLNMFPLSSQSVPKYIPEDVPNSTWVLWSHMVCPKFNSHVYKLKRLYHEVACCWEKQKLCCCCYSGGLKLLSAEISSHGCLHMRQLVLSSTILVTKFSIMDLLSIFQPSLFCTKKDPPQKKKKLSINYLSMILLLQDLLQVSGIIHPPKVYKAFLCGVALVSWVPFRKMGKKKKECKNSFQFMDFMCTARKCTSSNSAVICTPSAQNKKTAGSWDGIIRCVSLNRSLDKCF